MGVANFFVFLFIALSCFRLLRVSASKLPQEEGIFSFIFADTDWRCWSFSSAYFSNLLL